MRAGAAPIGVIDIGSNSVRLVVYEKPTRAITPLFNEKVLCGLGRGLAKSGTLNAKGVELARASLNHFTRVSRAMGVEKLHLLATAAVREAGNGPQFVTEVEAICKARVKVLSGGEEARLSALGVIAGLPNASGISGDLGGGSLELVEVEKGKIGRSATLGLGPLRLAEIAGDDRGAALKAIDAALAEVAWLGEARREVFYPVGGAWRTLARVHIEQHGYPLHIIHGYRLAAPEAIDLARVVSRLGSRSTARFKAVSRKRAEIVPLAALVLERVLKRLASRELIFSSTGLREGQVFDLLGKAEQAKDPLLAAAAEIGARESRFGDLGLALLAWSEPLFPEQPASERRLRQAACHLSDLVWRDHPDYRAELALARVLRLPLLGIDHPERCYLAIALHARYGGEADDRAIEAPGSLLAPEQVAKARALGLALRLAYSLSGATEGLLKRSRLRRSGGKLGLELADGGAGDTVERRLKALAAALDLKVE